MSQSSTPPLVVDGVYVKCDSSCIQCIEGGKCNLCRVGYALDSATSQCVVCNGCKSCTASDPSNCTSCFAPLVLNNSKCV